MQMKELTTVYRAEPFKPFTMYLADGRTVLVKHPEFIALSPTGRSVIAYETDGSFEVIDLLLVTSVRVANGQGRGTKKK